MSFGDRGVQDTDGPATTGGLVEWMRRIPVRTMNGPTNAKCSLLFHGRGMKKVYCSNVDRAITALENTSNEKSVILQKTACCLQGCKTKHATNCFPNISDCLPFLINDLMHKIVSDELITKESINIS